MAKRRRVNRRQPNQHVAAYTPCLSYNVNDPDNIEVFIPKPRVSKKVDVTTDAKGKLIVRVWE